MRQNISSGWERLEKAHGENIRPVANMVEISKPINGDLLIEIEVTAILETV